MSRKKNNLFWPIKYYAGLSETAKRKRRNEIKKGSARSWKDPKAYTGFQTDKLIKSKSSQYTQKWRRRFPNAKSLKQKSEATGVPLRFVKESYNRGLAAWRTGHRPGATQQQWGYARVHSFLLCGKTYHTADSDLARNAKKSSKTAKKWYKQCD